MLATVPHTGGLAQNQTYTGSATVVLPGVLPGNYHILVRADVANQEKEGPDKANNLADSGSIPIGVHSLATDGTTIQGAITSEDQVDYYALHLDAGESLRLQIDSQASGVPLELYVRYAAIPSRLRYDQRSAAPGTHQEIALTGVAGGGTYYIFVYGGQGPTSYTLDAEKAPFFLTDISPHRYGTSVPANITLTGTGFDNTSRVAFVNSDGAGISVPVQFVSESTLIATIDFTQSSPPGIGTPFHWEPGLYSVRVTKGTNTFTLAAAFDVVANGKATLETNLVVPWAVTPAFPTKQTIWIEYSNTGDVAMPAPLLQVVADGTSLLTNNEDLANALQTSQALPDGLGNSVQVLGIGSGATPGILQPGDSGRIPIYYEGQSQDKGARQVTFSLGSLTTMDTTEDVVYTTNPTTGRTDASCIRETRQRTPRHRCQLSVVPTADRLLPGVPHTRLGRGTSQPA